MKDLGRRTWVIPAGRIPEDTTGREPEYTSRDEMCVLNAGDEDARLAATVFHADRDPVGPYRFEVPAQRVRHVRANDLIDPEAVPLGVDYAIVLESDVPVVVQHVRLDSRRAEDTMFGTIAFPAA
jgi:hypothetical protein